jgi:hypothetical protein
MCFPAVLAALPAALGGTAAAGTAAATGAAATAATAATATTAAAATGMTAAQMISLGLSGAGTAISALGAINQASAAREAARNNQTMAEYAAQDSMKRGEEEAMQVRRRGAALKSSQRTTLAAKGLDLNYGTAADLQDQTDFFTESDVATTRDNAQRAAWNQRARGQAMLAQGRADSLNSMMQAGGSLLAGAGQVANKWYLYNKGGSGALSAGSAADW